MKLRDGGSGVLVGRPADWNVPLALLRAVATTQSSLTFVAAFLPDNASLSPNPHHFGRANVPSCRLHGRIHLRRSLAGGQSSHLRLACGGDCRSVPDDPYYPACRASGYPCDLCQAAELLRVESRARKELTELDDEEPEVIKERRLQERRLPEHSLLPSAPPS